MGPVIDPAARARIRSVIDAAEAAGARVLLDGRMPEWAAAGGAANESGFWVGPTVLEIPRHMRKHEAMTMEIFGPVRSMKTPPGRGTAALRASTPGVLAGAVCACGRRRPRGSTRPR